MKISIRRNVWDSGRVNRETINLAINEIKEAWF